MTAPIRSMPELEKIDGRFEVYRVILDGDALHEGFRDRVEDMGVTRLAIEEAGGFTGGHASKILCDPPIKYLGFGSLGKMLKATGTALVLVIDDERFAPIKAKMAKSKRPMRPNGSIRRPAWLISKEASQNMQVLRNKKLSPRQRKLIAKRAAMARWKKGTQSSVPIRVRG